MQNQLSTRQQRHEFAKSAAFGIGLPTALMSFIYINLKRVSTWGEIFSLLTVVEALILCVVNIGGCYVAGLLFWKLKRKAEDM
jgi:hypothetical protein